MNPRLLPLFSSIVTVLGLACSAGTSPGTDAGDPTPAAEINGNVITLGEVDEWIKDDLFQRSTQGGDPAKLFELRKKALDQIIDQRLVETEAETLGLTPEALLEQEARKLSTVSDAEVQAFYEQNKERMGEVPFEEVKPQIDRHLASRAASTATRAYVVSLRDSAQLDVHLEVPRTEVEASGPAIGPENAPVTIVEFSDYQCPYCKRAEPVIQQVLERYPDQVRFVYRHFPLDRIHPQARGASEAAACANEQGRFWDFHAKLFAADAKFDADSLRQYASDLELDLEAFQTCVDERRFQADIEADLVEGRQAGVSGTPAFFVNGIRIKGARPFDAFAEIIEEELRRSRS